MNNRYRIKYPMFYAVVLALLLTWTVTYCAKFLPNEWWVIPATMTAAVGVWMMMHGLWPKDFTEGAIHRRRSGDR